MAPVQKRRVSDTTARFSRFGECPRTDDALGGETVWVPLLDSRETYELMIARLQMDVESESSNRGLMTCVTREDLLGHSKA